MHSARNESRFRASCKGLRSARLLRSRRPNQENRITQIRAFAGITGQGVFACDRACWGRCRGFALLRESRCFRGRAGYARLRVAQSVLGPPRHIVDVGFSCVAVRSVLDPGQEDRRVRSRISWRRGLPARSRYAARAGCLAMRSSKLRLGPRLRNRQACVRSDG